MDDGLNLRLFAPMVLPLALGRPYVHRPGPPALQLTYRKLLLVARRLREDTVVDVVDGYAMVEPALMQSKKVTIIANGTIALHTEADVCKKTLDEAMRPVGLAEAAAH
jgi:hypothetical protein